MKTEVAVKAEDFGLEKSKVSELMGSLPSIKEERKEFEKQFSKVIKMPIEEIETSKVARELRLKIRDNRTKGINVWHKTTKDYFLKGGQFVDAIKRKEIAVNERMENDLEQIEKYAEIQEQKRQDELKQKRLSELEKYSEFVPMGIDFGIISQEEYEKIKNGAKLQFDAKVSAEKKAEEERLKRERLDKLENERIRTFERYIDFADEKNPDLRNMSQEDFVILMDSLQDKKAEYEEKQEQIRLENERLRKEAGERERKAEEERKKQAQLQAEIDAKLKAEKEAEERKRQQELKAKKEAEKLAKSPIKKQLNSWVSSFEIPETSINNELSKEIKSKFDSYKKWALTQIENL